MPGELLTPEEVAAKLKVSRKTVLGWLREGKLVGHKLGQQWRVSAEALEKFLQGDRSESDSESPLQRAFRPDEVAARLKVSRKTVLGWLRKGKLAGYRLGQQWRIPAAALEEFLRGGSGELEPEPPEQCAFTSAEVARLTGVNRKTLHYWVQEGFITPSLAGRYGTKEARLWSFGDLVALRVMQKLRQAGIDLRSTKVVLLLVEHIQKRAKIEEVPREVVLATDGREVFEVEADELPVLVHGAGMLLVVHLGRTVAELQALLALRE